MVLYNVVTMKTNRNKKLYNVKLKDSGGLSFSKQRGENMARSTAPHHS